MRDGDGSYTRHYATEINQGGARLPAQAEDDEAGNVAPLLSNTESDELTVALNRRNNKNSVCGFYWDSRCHSGEVNLVAGKRDVDRRSVRVLFPWLVRGKRYLPKGLLFAQ